MKRLLLLLLGLTAAVASGERASSQNPPKAVQKKAPAQASAKEAPKKADGDDPAVQQFEQQYGRQFQQLYRSELHFMRLVCQPTKQQYQKIAADSRAALKATVKKFAAHFREQQQGRFGPAEQADPRQAIAEVVAQSVRATLPPERSDRFQKELDQRTAALRRAVVLSLIAMMDKTLFLTSNQRDKLREILERNWNESWSIYVIAGGGYYFPTMPDAKIEPILTPTQKTVWQGMPKGNVHYGFRLAMVNVIAAEDDPWDEASPAAKEQPQKVEKK